MICNSNIHDYEKIILAKKYSFGSFGFIWFKCKKCGSMKPSMFPCDLDHRGMRMSSRLERVVGAHPNYPVVWRNEENGK